MNKTLSTNILTSHLYIHELKFLLNQVGWVLSVMRCQYSEKSKKLDNDIFRVYIRLLTILQQKAQNWKIKSDQQFLHFLLSSKVCKKLHIMPPTQKVNTTNEYLKVPLIIKVYIIITNSFSQSNNTRVKNGIFARRKPKPHYECINCQPHKYSSNQLISGMTHLTPIVNVMNLNCIIVIGNLCLL